MKKQEEKPNMRSDSKLGAFPAHIDALWEPKQVEGDSFKAINR